MCSDLKTEAAHASDMSSTPGTIPPFGPGLTTHSLGPIPPNPRYRER